MTTNSAAIRTKIPRPALRVVHDASAQQCATCRSLRLCWSSTDPHAIVLNLLICRVHRGVDRTRSLATISSMLRKKIHKIAGKVARQHGLDADDAFADLQVELLDALCNEYVIGEISYPLRFLFHWPDGVAYRWRRNYLREHVDRQRPFVSYGLTIDRGSSYSFDRIVASLNRAATDQRVTAPRDDWSTQPDDHAREDTIKETELAVTARRVLDAIEDGVTLPLAEYRIVRFCFANADQAKGRSRRNRPVGGLHRHLAQATGQDSRRTSKLFASGVRRLVDVAGLARSYLRQLGIDLDPVLAKRRQQRAKSRFRAPFDALPRTDVALALEFVTRYRRADGSFIVPLAELAWTVGVHEDTLRRLLRRAE